MASEGFLAQVRLLMRVLPLLGDQEALALKGGTAINLFVQNLPRLSVDIDLAYTGLEDRGEALARIHAGLARMQTALEALGLSVHPTPLSGTPHVVKLIVRDRSVQIKVEVSPVLRGTVYPPERRQPSPEVQARFGFAEVPVLALPDLYAGKLVAALDRQHPRDLYDVRLFLEQERLTHEVRLAFLVYLVSHGRPLHEVLRPRFKDIRGEYEQAFRGMTVNEVPLEALEQSRVDLLDRLHAAFTADDRAFLLSVAESRPRWDLLSLDGISDLPAVRWKLHNIGLMTPAKRTAAIRTLESALETGGQQE